MTAAKRATGREALAEHATAHLRHDLGPAELEVLKVLWEQGPSTVRGVLGQLRAQGRRVAYTTVLTFLSRLEQKGFVSTDRSGIAYIYRAAVARKAVVKSRLRSMVRELFDGRPGPLIAQLMEQESFTADEVSQLQRLVANLGDGGRGDDDGDKRRGPGHRRQRR